jgi:SAM-dependent methyltransferase
MFPKTKYGERVHREHKRHLEIGIVIEEILQIIKNDSDFISRDIRLFEFGSGDGFQIPHLKRLGKVVASDIYTSDEIKRLKDIEFLECGISSTPFATGQFNLIYSNHVIEHIDDLKSAFREMQRIGLSSCIYAFTVPTNIWLLFSIPAQYYNLLRRIIGKVKEQLINTATILKRRNKNNYLHDERHKTHSTNDNCMRLLLPRGHGVISNFIECYRCFKIENWQQLFSDNGFIIIKTKPLLLYGPSEWPIIPTVNCKSSFCSSVLFLMIKNL